MEQEDRKVSNPVDVVRPLAKVGTKADVSIVTADTKTVRISILDGEIMFLEDGTVSVNFTLERDSPLVKKLMQGMGIWNVTEKGL